MSKIIIREYIIASFLALSISFVFSGSVSAQSAETIEKKADKYFKANNYYNAAILYSTILYQMPQDKYSDSLVYPVQFYKKRAVSKIKEATRNRVTYKLDESYRLYNLYKDDFGSFKNHKSSKTKTVSLPLAELWYAYFLLSKINARQADSVFHVFLNKYHHKDIYTKKALEGIESCNIILLYNSENPKVILTKIQATIPEDGENFGFEKINDTEFSFTSSRQEKYKKQKKRSHFKLYSGNLKTNSVNNVFDQFSIDLNIAANSLGNNGNTVFFTGWKEDSKSSEQNFGIYYVKRKDENTKWSNPILLPAPVNVKGYQSKHPALSEDGKYLLFSSNQPNGLGKFDLWMVEIDGEKPIGNALNLGANINTSGNEVTPFYNAITSHLTFSSDGRFGMGGMDIYETNGSLSNNQWNDSITHPGWPYNSLKDDQYFKSYGNADTGFLSSNRFSSCCLMEIFQTIKNKDTINSAIHKVDLVLNDVTIPEDELDPFENKNELTSTEKSIAKNSIITKNIINSSTSEKKIDSIEFNKTITEKEKIEKLLIDSINSNTYARRNVYYKFASSTIRKKDYLNLDTIVSILENNPELNILIASFTDCKGSQEANVLLSRKRSESVRLYLIKKGIATARINIDYFGKTHFIKQCNEDTTYRSGPQLANRRSDLIITQSQNPTWIPSGRELDITKIKRDSNYHSMEFYAIMRKMNLSNNIKVGHVENNKFEKVILQPKNNKIEGENLKSTFTNTKSNNKSIERNKDVNSVSREKNAPRVEKLPGITWNYNEKKYLVPLPNQLPISQLLDMTPRLKESEIIETMTKRVPRKPLEVFSTSDSVRIDLYDNGIFDYDTVSVIFDKHIAVYKELLQADKPISFYVKLNGEQRKNEMIFFAENLGLTPPNSALMVITDSDHKRTEVNVASDLNNNVVIYFIKLNKSQLKKDN
jgi:outer membrane protein OmpA-like peptidoglycan-associated protein